MVIPPMYGDLGMVYDCFTHIIWLVVWTPLKNMKVNGKDDIPYMKWKIVWIHQPVINGY